MEVLATKPATRLLSRANFVRGVKPLHFIVLSHETAAYTLTASGILLDAIAWQKPVIARKIPIFEAIFEKHGDIGYLFTDDQELEEIVGRIITVPDKSHYDRQILHLRAAKTARDPKTLASSYLELCWKLGEASQEKSDRPPYQECRL
jgi:hypothetical protein